LPDIACRNCGAKVSDEFSYCVNCGTSLEVKGATTTNPSRHSKKVCVDCGAPVTPRLRFCSSCGRALSIDLADVLNSTIRIIRTRPAIVMPLLLLSVINGVFLASFSLQLQSKIASLTTHTSLLDPSVYTILGQLLVVGLVEGLTIYPLVNGMYPSMVKAAMLGERVELSSVFKKSLRKYPSIVTSYILVAGGIILASLALIIPGIIVSTWYYYTTPAIVLGDRGASDGMSASHAFARDKKWETFGLLLVSVGPSLLGNQLAGAVPLTTWNGIPHLAIVLFFGFVSSILGAMLASYVYLTYAMSKQHTAEA